MNKHHTQKRNKQNNKIQFISNDYVNQCQNQFCVTTDTHARKEKLT